MKHWFMGIQGAWMVLFLWATPLCAEQQTLLDGHILDEITLSPEEEDTTLLTLRGVFSLRLLPEIELITQEDSKRWVIVIPKALVNNLSLSDGISFPPLSALRNIEIDEEVETAGEDLQFQSSLYLTAAQPVSLSWVENQTNEQQLTFSILREEPEIEVIVEEVVEMKQPLKPLPLLSERLNVRGSAISGLDPVLLHPVSAMLLFQRPLTFHLSILNASPNQESAQRLAILLDRHFRKFLEDQLDMRMNITNISSVQEQTSFAKTTIYFRPNYLKAALALATVIPGEQIVERMSLEQRGRLGLDIEIYAGANVE